MEFAQVYGSLNQTLKNKVINFWIDQNCMPEDIAKLRVEEALFAILEDGNIVAVCSGKPVWVDQLRDNFIYYRTYTKSDYRKKDLSKILFNLTKEYLNKNRIINGIEMKGIYFIYESSILNKLREFVRPSGTLIGWTDKNQQIRVLYLDGAKINI